MSTILGRFSEYLNLKSLTEEDLPETEEAIQNYLDQGGLLKVDDSADGDPDLIYPGPERIKKQLRNAKEKEKYLQHEVLNLRRKKRKKTGKAVKTIKKTFDPLYWEHKYKMNTDEDYKETYEEIQPPIEKINDPEWRNMLNMFIKESEYRERLLEASRSEISKGTGTMRDQMKEREEFSEEVIDKRINKLQDKLENFKEKRKALKVLLKWAGK